MRLHHHSNFKCEPPRDLSKDGPLLTRISFDHTNCHSPARMIEHFPMACLAKQIDGAAIANTKQRESMSAIGRVGK